MNERALVPALLLALILASIQIYRAWRRAQLERMLDDFARRWSDPRPRVTCQLLEPASPPFTREAFLAEMAKPRPRQKIERGPLLNVSLGLHARRAARSARRLGDALRA